MTTVKILVVEDEGIVAEEIRSRLKKLDYTVSAVVHSGGSAIQKAEEMRPDLVLMDIQLKGEIDGIDAAQQIQEHLDIPVVYLTAHADENTLQRAKLTNPFGYVLKPFEEKELYVAIEIALYKHKAEKERVNREKLEAVLETAGAVCHELNQPMMTIAGYSELLLLKKTGDDPIYDKLDKILDQIDRMGKITRKLMTITRYATKDYSHGKKIIDLDKSSSTSE